MTPSHSMRIGHLHELLHSTLHAGGARASRLLQFTPNLIEALYPADDFPDLTDFQRAFHAERDLRAAVAAVGGDAGAALSAILALDPGLSGRKLHSRRRIAGRYFDVQAVTFARNYEGPLLHDLAVELCYMRGNHESSRTDVS